MSKLPCGSYETVRTLALGHTKMIRPSEEKCATYGLVKEPTVHRGIKSVY